MYKPTDFNDMKYNVFADWSTPIWTQYEVFRSRPDLCQIPLGVFLDDEVVTDKDLDRLIRYVILYCSRKNNPLSRELDMDQRREAIWTLLHISKKDPLRGYVEHWHKWVVKVMVVFLRMENDMEYSSWLTDKIQYYQYLEYQMMSPTMSDDMDKMMTIKDRISKIKPQLEDSLKKKESVLFPDIRMRDEISEMEMKMMDGKGGFAEYVVGGPFPRFMTGDPAKME